MLLSLAGYKCAKCPLGYDTNPVNGVCVDTDGCKKNPCDAKVKCIDVKAPGQGASCGQCPPGSIGNGLTTKKLPTRSLTAVHIHAQNQASPLGQCEGDCDRDSHCKAGFKCFQRNKRQTVPGCIPGGTLDMNSGDYCYKPGVKTAIPFHTFHWSGHLRLMERCEGDCDNNNHCGWNVGSGLKCFQRKLRNNKRAIPGCISIRALVRPSAPSATSTFSPSPSPLPPLFLLLRTARFGCRVALVQRRLG